MHLTLHLTESCNLRCDYCYSPPRTGPVMSRRTAERALRLGAGLSERSCGVVFFGGEPLLARDRIRETVAAARALEGAGELRFHFKITTNGLLLDDEFLSWAIPQGILVALSVDGVARAHDRHRRRPDGSGSFEVVRERLTRLLAVMPYSPVLMVVNPDTTDALTESVTFLLDEGARYLILSLNYGADWRESDLRVLERELRRLARLYERCTREGRKFYLSPFETKISSHVNRDGWREDRCELARRQISVAPDGHLYPCVQFTRAGPASEWCIGHVDTGIDEAARARVRLRSAEEKEECAACAIRARCHHTCGCLNWQATGSVNRVSGVLCRYERMMLPIADRVARRLYRRRDPLFLHKHYNPAWPVLSVLEDTRRP